MSEPVQETIVPIEGDGSIRTSTFEQSPKGADYVRVCDRDGHEMGYWDHAEWSEDPVAVMGAITGTAVAGRV